MLVSIVMTASMYHLPHMTQMTATAHRVRTEPAYGAYALLRAGFVALPILFGLDKFGNLMTNWEHYLAPWIVRLLPVSAHTGMLIVGGIEILAGLAVAVKPRYAAYIVVAWLAGIIVNLLSYSGFYDVALRDFGLLVGALTLARLASIYDPAWHRPAR